MVFACIDWRLHPTVEHFFRERWGTFDLCVSAGSIKDFTNKETAAYLLNQLELSLQLHRPKEVVLTMHSDCGAYGGLKAFFNRTAEKQHHKNELATVAAMIRERFPALTVRKYILDLRPSGAMWDVRPVAVR